MCIEIYVYVDGACSNVCVCACVCVVKGLGILEVYYCSVALLGIACLSSENREKRREAETMSVR